MKTCPYCWKELKEVSLTHGACAHCGTKIPEIIKVCELLSNRYSSRINEGNVLRAIEDILNELENCGEKLAKIRELTS